MNQPISSLSDIGERLVRIEERQIADREAMQQRTRARDVGMNELRSDLLQEIGGVTRRLDRINGSLKAHDDWIGGHDLIHAERRGREHERLAVSTRDKAILLTAGGIVASILRMMVEALLK